MPLLLPLLLAALVLAPGASAAAPPADQVHTTASEHRGGERLKTIPITPRAWGAPRSVMSLEGGDVGELRNGTELQVYGDMEVSVCLKPNALHDREKKHPCIGKTYGYDPKIKAQVVIGGSADAAGGSSTLAVSAVKTYECTQKQPNRNHHCVITVPWSSIEIGPRTALPCAPGDCHVNMVLSAYHPDAKPKHNLVVGASDDKGKINQGKGVLSTVLKGSAGLQPDAVARGAKRVRGKIPIEPSGGDRKDVVIHSLRIDDPRAGEQLRIDASASLRIGHLPYNALVRSQLVVADSAKATDPGRRAAKVADSNTRLSAENGFNCTLGPSGHPDPCQIRKGGILSIRQGSSDPIYINLVVGLGAQGTSTMYSKWRAVDRARVGGGSIVAERYRGTSACSSCQLTGGGGSGSSSFSATKRPSDPKLAKLVDQLADYGIVSGELDCGPAGPDSRLTCDWTSSGSFSPNRPFACAEKAWWQGSRWEINVCKDAVGALLWQRLEQGGLAPTFAGTCLELADGRLRCQWFAKGAFGDGTKYFCRGEGTYDATKRAWQLDPCRNERE